MSRVLFCIGILMVVYSSVLTGQRTWDGKYLAVDVANDLFYLPLKTDQYFTSGISLEVGKREDARSPFRVTSQASRSTYWRLTQNIYTPREIESTTLLTNDRPFASYLIASRGKSYTDAALGFGISTAWTVGILGKYSGGGSMQNALHEIVSFADPLPGWVYEVKPDLLLNYTASFSKMIPFGQRLQLSTSLRGQLGSLYTNLSPELILRWRAIKLSESRTLHFDLRGNARLVGYDATLTGGLINRDERYRGRIQPSPLVGQFDVNGYVKYDAWQLRGGICYLSPEFDGGLPHVWAWLGVSLRPGWSQPTASRPNSRP